jgi:hypothetical protein
VNDASQAYFVLAGIAVFERQGHWISEKLEDIATRFNPGEPGTIELHGSPMLNGVKIWRQYPLPDRIQAMKDALEVVRTSHSSNQLFGVAVRKASITGRDPIEFAFEQICNRFDLYLLRLHRQGDTQRGLIVFDKSTKETTIQELATDFRRTGHSWGLIRNLAEVPVFLDSRASRLVQLADLIAYGMFRHFERNDSQFFDIVRDRFDSEGGITHGLVHRA